MGQMKETLQDDTYLQEYQEAVAKTPPVLNWWPEYAKKLSEDLLKEIRELEFSIRVLHDSVADFYNELNK